ncbi:hypothetical protein Holit_00673 [Hollandina sp. SP2]
MLPEADKLFKTAKPAASAVSWAIRFALSPPMMALSGMSTLNQLVDNSAFMRDFKPLDENEQPIVKDAMKIIKSKIAIL